jgi:hypothetical protein
VPISGIAWEVVFAILNKQVSIKVLSFSKLQDLQAYVHQGATKPYQLSCCDHAVLLICITVIHNRHECWVQGLFLALLLQKRCKHQCRLDFKCFSSFCLGFEIPLRHCAEITFSTIMCLYFILNIKKKTKNKKMKYHGKKIISTSKSKKGKAKQADPKTTTSNKSTNPWSRLNQPYTPEVEDENLFQTYIETPPVRKHIANPILHWFTNMSVGQGEGLAHMAMDFLSAPATSCDME